MGCGASRLKNVTPESIPARFRPILRRRIEEVRRRRRLDAAKDESSKEELLLAKADHDYVDDQKSEKTRDIDSVTSFEEEREREAETKRREGDDVASSDGEDLTDESSIAFPGSPSFRIYFVDNGDEDDDDDDDRTLEIIKEEGVKEKIQSGDLDAVLEKKPGTKTVVKKRRSLKMAIPRGGQNAVKNLLNVKGCYTPPCGARPDRAHLIAAKSQS